MTCSRRKPVVMGRRRAFLNSQNSATTSASATKYPIRGDVTIGTRTLSQIPSGFSADGPDAISVAPIRPPINAWLLDEGSPRLHVIRFQVIAPISAAATTAVVDVASSTRPEPMVLATAVPAKAPMK